MYSMQNIWECFINISFSLMKNRQRIYWRCIIMNGTKPEFLKKSTLNFNSNYFKKPDPYTNAPSCHINLLELSRYAKNTVKNLLNLLRMKLKSFQFNIHTLIQQKSRTFPLQNLAGIFVMYYSIIYSLIILISSILHKVYVFHIHLLL